jgi:predicted DCC family thiol-disulfide oxidoreductase YuxK
VVVYDGQCRFCLAQMERIRRRDRGSRFEYVANQHPALLDRFPILGQTDLQTGLRLITPDGQVHVGADAIYEVARRLPVWRHWAWLYRAPGCRTVAGWVYQKIAAHRYHLAGRCETGACRP